MPPTDIPFEILPQEVRANLTREQWVLARRGVVEEGTRVPETTRYINLKNGLGKLYHAGDRADAPLLAQHDLAGGRGSDDTQFRTAPPGAHGVP